MKQFVGLLLTIATLMFDTETLRAQQSIKIYRIGVLTQRPVLPPGLLSGLRDLGYVEGKNIVIVHRWATAGSNLMSKLAEELVTLKVDVIVAHTPAAIAPVVGTTTTIPIIMIEAGDPVLRGFVQSLATPGRNVTGLSAAGPCVEAKRVELIREILTKASRVTLLRTRESRQHFEKYLTATALVGMKLKMVDALNADAFENAYSKIIEQAPHVLLTSRDPLSVTYTKQISEFTLKSNLPWMSDAAPFVEAGGLISCGPNYDNSARRGAIFIDKILKGANPALLPIEPPDLELAVNLKTARAIGVKIPPHILLEAHRVIK